MTGVRNSLCGLGKVRLDEMDLGDMNVEFGRWGPR